MVLACVPKIRSPNGFMVRKNMKNNELSILSFVSLCLAVLRCVLPGFVELCSVRFVAVMLQKFKCGGWKILTATWKGWEIYV